MIMNKKIKYFFAGAFALSLAFTTVACSSDDDGPIDDFDAAYVHLVRPKLGSELVSYSVKHLGDDIVGTVEIPIVVRVSKPQTSAIKIELNMKSETAFGQSLKFKGDGDFAIAAGETEVRDTLIVTNWDFALETTPATSFETAISIGSINPLSKKLRISTKLNNLIIKLSKGKRINTNVVPNETPAGTPLNRTNWTVTMSKNKNELTWVAADKVKTDDNATILYNYGYIGFTVDLGAVQTLTGLKTSGGKYYSCKTCVVLTSDDGVTWASQSDDTEPDVVKEEPVQYFSFKKPVTTRFVRWRMYRNTENVGTSEIQAYSQQ